MQPGGEAPRAEAAGRGCAWDPGHQVPGRRALTAEWEPAQAHRQTFPVTELCAFDSRECFCGVLFVFGISLKTNILRGNCHIEMVFLLQKLKSIKVKILTLPIK